MLLIFIIFTELKKKLVTNFYSRLTFTKQYARALTKKGSAAESEAKNRFYNRETKSFL